MEFVGAGERAEERENDGGKRPEKSRPRLGLDFRKLTLLASIKGDLVHMVTGLILFDGPNVLCVPLSLMDGVCGFPPRSGMSSLVGEWTEPPLHLATCLCL